ncbi:MULTISPECIES: hypothetical protein [unclassified Phaeobacter]|uniref:hypothetical protein n=1 Tax=unclassified Phaeobacter TaxID=2621772 RepID=UPI003A859653
MNVIIIILAVIAVASSFSIWAGLVMLFFKSRRKKGARIAAISLFNIVVLGGAGAVLQEKYGTAPDASLTATQTTGSEASIIASAATTSTTTTPAQSTNAPAWKVAGFPSQKVAEQAAALGWKSYSTYRLRNNGDAIALWCEMDTTQRALSHQRDAELNANPGEEARKEITGRYDALQRDLTANLASQLGIKEWELNKLSMNAPWPTYCRAKSKGWAVVTPELAAGTSRADAKEAREALYYFYLGNLSAGTSPFFDNDRYSSVNCKWENVGDMRVVGCKLQSFSAISDWDLFTVARLKNGRLVVAPMDGQTSTHITSLGDLNYVQVADFPRAYLAEFAGEVDFTTLREEFN